MALLDDINRLLRDHTGYTGDGQGGSGPLPVGDRSTARFPINKRDLRELLIGIAQAMGDPGALQDIIDELGDKADKTAVDAETEAREAADNLGDMIHLNTAGGSTAQHIIAAIPTGQSHLSVQVAGRLVQFTTAGSNPEPDPDVTIGGNTFVIRRHDGTSLRPGEMASGRRYIATYSTAGDLRLIDMVTPYDLDDEAKKRQEIQDDLNQSIGSLLPGIHDDGEIYPLIIGDDEQTLLAVDGAGVPVIPFEQGLYYSDDAPSEHLTGIDRSGNRLFGFDEVGNPAYQVQGLLYYGDPSEADWDFAFLDDRGRPVLRWLNGRLVGAGSDGGALPLTEKEALADGLDWNDRGTLRRAPALYLSDPLYNDPIPTIYSGAGGLYALYDGLMSDYPDYITRSSIGQDQDDVHIYQYQFTASQFVRWNWSAAETNPPKIIMISGTHGGEVQAQLRQFIVLRNLCEHWRDLPGYHRLRFGLDLVVVPCAAPWTIDNPGRVNKSGVNINRNFPIGWDDAPSDPGENYRGPSPASELETQAIMTLPTLHPDAVAVIDNHNGTGVDYTLWFGAGRRSQLEIAKSVVPDLHDHLRRTIRPDFDPQARSTYFTHLHDGSLARWMQDGPVIPTILIEQSSGPGHAQLDGTNRSHRRLGEIAILGIINAFLDREVRTRTQLED